MFTEAKSPDLLVGLRERHSHFRTSMGEAQSFRRTLSLPFPPVTKQCPYFVRLFNGVDHLNCLVHSKTHMGSKNLIRWLCRKSFDLGRDHYYGEIHIAGLAAWIDLHRQRFEA